MSSASGLAMGNDARPNVLPVKPASGPGFLGPQYNPADEMLPPASIGVHRGGDLNDVIGAVKGVIYYGDMMGFGEPSSEFTKGMPGLKPLGVNYFINSGLTCSNGATMWEYVPTIPTGSALGQKVKDALRGIGLPQLRGMAPGILEDAESALNPAPVINAVVGSGYPQCRLMKMPVGDAEGKIQNVDGVLLVDPDGLILGNDGKYYQERWIQDRTVKGPNRPGETDYEHYMRSEPIQLSYDQWSNTSKVYGDDGCLLDASSGSAQPSFCGKKKTGGQVITLGDGTTVTAYSDDSMAVTDTESFEDYRRIQQHSAMSLAIAAVAILGLGVFWSFKMK